MNGPHKTGERSTTVDPRSFASLFDAGLRSGQRGQYDEAARLMALAALADPRSADAHFMCGSALLQAMRFEEAIASFDSAITLRQHFPEALLNRAAALFRLKRYEEAERDYDALLTIDPDYPYARGNRLFCRLHLCDWRDLEKETAAIADGISKGKRVIAPFDAKALWLRPEDELRCASIWAGDQVPPVSKVAIEPHRHAKIRIAYVAESFGEDPVSMLLAGVIEQHDRTRFDVIGVALDGFRPSPLGARIMKACDRTLAANARADAEFLAELRALEIDIAVDLQGFTQGCRPEVFAGRIAPIQVNYLGFPGTMGSEFVDYMIADRIVIPEPDRRYYRENVVYFPGTYLPCDSARMIVVSVPSRSDVGLPETGFVFASFNNSYKFYPRMFDIWMRVLGAVEGSVLWLPKTNQVAIDNLSREAETRGIDKRRLVFAPFLPDPKDHLARLQCADLFLDTLPYNAHSTAIDALQAGLPVLTCEGETFAGRVAASVLKTAGLRELVTKSLEEYEALALRMAREPQSLVDIKTKLVATHSKSFDTKRYVRHLESAYATMWERAQRGLSSESFAVAERA